MIITSLCLENWRNIEKCLINPHSEVNVIYGDNAQGKTNLIEAIWTGSGFSSFRGGKESEFLRFGKDSAHMQILFFSEERNQKIDYLIKKETKKIFLNDVNMKSPSSLSEAFKCVVFSPENLSLLSGSPQCRRKFLDTALSGLKPSYHKLINSYKRAVEQRNALLKEISRKSRIEYLWDCLDMFENHIANMGSKISSQRNALVEKLLPFSTEFFEGLSGSREILSIKYTGEIYAGENGKQLLKKELEESRNEDIRLLSTCKGPHRHDLELLINGISARDFGSQGQKRSAALALKLAEASVIAEYTGEQPIILLDDVLSELDFSRQDYIINRLEGRQVFITCCDPTPVMKMTGGKAFYTSGGCITEKI